MRRLRLLWEWLRLRLAGRRDAAGPERLATEAELELLEDTISGLPWGGWGLSSPPVEGPRIAALQRRLGLPPTGRYDEETAERVEAVKRSRGLALEGLEGRATPELLRSLELPDEEGPP